MCRLIPYSAWEQDKGWLRRVQVALIKSQQVKLLHDEHRSNLFGRCSVARKAVIQAKRIRNLITEGKRLLDIARARPLPVRYIMQQVPQDGLLGIDSAIRKIFEFVNDYDSSGKYILSICGMCGTGKSSLLKLVRDLCVQAASFDYVIFAVATYECSIPKLQKIIFSNLGLNIAMTDEESDAAVIFNVLKDKSFLLLLDNLWIRADLEKIGIPIQLGSAHRVRHKIIFTTQSFLVSADMECGDHCIILDCLTASNAWRLFRDKVGDNIIYSDPYISFLARKVVDLCHGLPIALCAVGRVMSIMDDPKDWSEAVKCLKRSGIIELLGSNSDMFHSLKVSYDHLEKRVRDCFLVCSLFEKGKSISRDTLLQWWTGLGLLDMKHAPVKSHMIITKLLAVGLLQKGENNHEYSEHSHVKVHPILHDMSLWIVNESKKDWLLLLSFSSLSSISNWQQHWLNLSFLDLSSVSSMNEFPKEICNMVNPQYLNLSGTKIISLPFELLYLSELKFLYLRQMKELRDVPCWAIARFKKLQVLDFFSDVITLASVHMLPFIESPGQAYTTSLLLEVEKSHMQLEAFSLCVQSVEQINILSHLPMTHVRSLSIDKIEQDGSHFGEEQGKMNLKHLPQTENLTELSITRCSFMKEVVADGELSYGQSGLLPNLEYLCLGHVEKVIWKNAGLNLRVVCLFQCTVKHASWLQKLPCLVEIKVTRCSQMVLLVDSTSQSDDLVRNQAAVTFPRLEKLTLQWLPELSSLSDIKCEVGKLRYLQVHVCNRLKSLCLHPHRNQSKIMIWCSGPWWGSLEWDSEVMKPYLLPMCNVKGTSLDDQPMETYSETAVSSERTET